jgi:uncharacterized caspase-like protein
VAALEEVNGRRLALVIATSSYSDPTLAKLRSPGHDAKNLAEVLGDNTIGEFAVERLLDAKADTVRRRIALFCAQGGPRDLALIYLSCHGLLDDRGRLYYTSTDTDRELLSVTAVQAAWLNEHLDDCRCRRQILILDCCHSGAFAKGAKGTGALALRERFEARGRIVLTASRATEYSFEGSHIAGHGENSVFTAALVDGLRTGDADRDRDGLITVNELYDYAFDAVKAREPRQSPSLWSYGAEGNLVVARSAHGAIIQPTPPPENLSVQETQPTAAKPKPPAAKPKMPLADAKAPVADPEQAAAKTAPARVDTQPRAPDPEVVTYRPSFEFENVQNQALTKPHHKRTVASLTAIVLTVIALIVIMTPGEDTDAQVRNALQHYAQAIRAKDYQTLCDDSLASKLTDRIRSAGLPCEVALKTGLDERKNPSLKVLSVETNGDKATARVRSTATGEKTSVDTFRLIKESGEWRITSQGGS